MQSTFSENEIDNIKSIKQKMWTGVQSAMDRTLPSHMMTFLRDNAILTGGATASIFHGDLPSDWDLYLKGQQYIDDFNDWVKNKGNEEYIEDIDEKYTELKTPGGKLVTTRAVTFKNKIQVITMQTSEKRTQFDMLHCMPWYDLKNDILHISRAQYDSIRDKKIVKNTHADAFPITSWRMDKYMNRGWKV
jgi:hypothetical protein